MTIGERIRKLRGKLSQEDFARSIGASKTAVGAYEKDSSKPGADVIMSICAQFSVDPKWLLFGDGPMRVGKKHEDMVIDLGALDDTVAELRALEEAEDSSSPRRASRLCDVDMVYVPLVGARLSAGTGSFETGGESERRYAFRADFLSRKGQPSQMVLMRVVGNSMEPNILHDDVVLIDQSQTTPTPGALFAVGIMDMVYIKMVDALPGRIVLKSSNPDYGPIDLDARGDLADGIRIVGKAVWLGRELR